MPSQLPETRSDGWHPRFGLKTLLSFTAACAVLAVYASRLVSQHEARSSDAEILGVLGLYGAEAVLNDEGRVCRLSFRTGSNAGADAQSREAMKLISRLDALRMIDFRNTQADAETLSCLHGLTQLQHAWLTPLTVSRESAEELKEHLPGIQIYPELYWASKNLPALHRLFNAGLIMVQDGRVSCWRAFSGRRNASWQVSRYVTDDSFADVLALLAETPKEHLYVINSNLSDEGLLQLLPYTNYSTIALCGIEVRPETLSYLNAEMPETRITVEPGW